MEMPHLKVWGPQVWGKRSGQTVVVLGKCHIWRIFQKKKSQTEADKTLGNEYYHAKLDKILHETPAWAPK